MCSVESAGLTVQVWSALQFPTQARHPVFHFSAVDHTARAEVEEGRLIP